MRASRVADLAAHADRAAEPQRIMPVIELTTELRADRAASRFPAERIERLAGQMRDARRAPGPVRACGWPRWAAVAGIDDRARPAGVAGRTPR